MSTSRWDRIEHVLAVAQGDSGTRLGSALDF